MTAYKTDQSVLLSRRDAYTLRMALVNYRTLLHSTQRPPNDLANEAAAIAERLLHATEDDE